MRHSTATIGCLMDSRFGPLDTDPLALAAHRFAQIGHLFAHHVVDCFARGIHVLAHGIGDVIERKVIDQLCATLLCRAVAASGSLGGPGGALASLIRCPSGAWGCSLAGPSCALESGKSGPTRTSARCADNRTNGATTAGAHSE